MPCLKILDWFLNTTSILPFASSPVAQATFLILLLDKNDSRRLALSGFHRVKRVHVPGGIPFCRNLVEMST